MCRFPGRSEWHTKQKRLQKIMYNYSGAEVDWHSQFTGTRTTAYNKKSIMSIVKLLHNILNKCYTYHTIRSSYCNKLCQRLGGHTQIVGVIITITFMTAYSHSCPTHVSTHPAIKQVSRTWKGPCSGSTSWVVRILFQHALWYWNYGRSM